MDAIKNMLKEFMLYIDLSINKKLLQIRNQKMLLDSEAFNLHETNSQKF